MTEFSAVSLRIETVGAKEAFNSLVLLDEKGRKVVDAAAGAMGRAMGDVASAYTRGGAQMQAVLQNVAKQHEANIRVIELEQRTTERAMASASAAVDQLEMRQAHSVATASRGLEMLGRTGQLTGRSLDAVVGQIAAMAFSFGPTGQIVAAIGITTAAVIELFMRTSKEAKKLADEAIKEFERIAQADVRGQGEAIGKLYSGDKSSANATLAASLPELKRLAAIQKAAVDGGTLRGFDQFGEAMNRTTPAARAASTAYKTLNDEIERRQKLLSSSYGINGRGGSLERAAADQVHDDQAGFATDAQKDAEAARKAGERAARQAAKASAAFDKALQKQLAEYIKTTAGEQVDEMIEMDDLKNGVWRSLIPDAKAIKEWVHEVGITLHDAIKHDPVLKRIKAIDDASKLLAKQFKETLSRSLGEGIGQGLEEAFSGKGIGNAFKTLTAHVLAGLGSFMEQLGIQMVIVGVALDAMASALLTLNGPAAIAAGVGLIAAGAALKAVAGSFGKGGDSGSFGGSGGSSGGGATGSTFLTFGVTPAGSSTSSGAAPSRMPTMTFNVIGNDPKVQRDIAAIVNAAASRNLIPGMA